MLARKWRPRSFREMVGQGHVLKALINALDSQRLHHAYLFTGTRGVGKTTIARIMAKCLNCEQGVSSTPCGVCSICREIDEGRFVDLIEVDAASKTKVEDTRELLDNVQYMPSRGRYKVYLIDEVHMLSTSSFNALLKTLEEPPPHVKFLLATTDPQKLPPTVLSRCLQFSLKNMPPESIVGHLSHVLASENIPFEEQALWLLGRAADGSMRDAMSLTDQAVSFGEGKVLAEDVRAMLGTLDQGQVFSIASALLAGDAQAMLQAIAELAEQGPDWQGVLAELLGVLHRVAIAQVMPNAIDNGQGDKEQILQLAQAMPAEDTQFYYQVALMGRRDLPLSPDPRDGFEMVMLRMLAFRPASLPGAPSTPLVFNQPKSSEPVMASALPPAPTQIESTAPLAPVAQAEPVVTAEQPAPPEQPEERAEPAIELEVPPVEKTVVENPSETFAQTPHETLNYAEEGREFDDEQDIPDYSYLDYVESQSATDSIPEGDLKPHIPPATGLAARWINLCQQLDISGMTANIARNCALIKEEGNTWLLHLDSEQSALFNETQQKRINEAVNTQLGQEIQLQVEVAPLTVETPALDLARKRAQQQLDAVASLEQDPLIQAFKQELGAVFCAESIKPINPI